MYPEATEVSFPAQLFELNRRFGTDITELVLRTEQSEENRVNMLQRWRYKKGKYFFYKILINIQREVKKKCCVN